MKTMTKRTAVAALTGVMAVGMLTGCGEKKLDGTKTVATVDGTEIPLGIVSLSVREGQAQTEAMYKSFMGGQDYSIWSMDAEDGKTYGEQAVEQSLKDVELMYIMKEKAADYNVEVTDDDEQKIADAAAAFMAANITNTRRTEIKTPDVVIHIDPDRAALIETQVIDGRKCIVIPMEGDVEINGIHVSSGNSESTES